MPKFLLQYQGATTKEFPVTKAEITVGRLPTNDIVIDNPAVSSHHCKIKVIGGRYYIEDNGSTNGVFVNAEKVLKAELRNNDVIGIVKHTLKFVDERPVIGRLARASAAGFGSGTVMVAPAKVEPVTPPTPKRKPAVVRILKGAVDQSECELRARSTYIGKSPHVQIKIKGTGLFGAAPENAAMISNTDEGYFIVPVQPGYARLNGTAVTVKEALKDGDVIQVGGTTLQFEEKS